MNFSAEDQQIGMYYDSNAGHEWERLARHRVEFALTQATVSEYGPSAPADILDVGGGPGRYAIWLADQGHRVSAPRQPVVDSADSDDDASRRLVCPYTRRPCH